MIIVPGPNHHDKYYRIAIVLLMLSSFLLSSFFSKDVFERLPHLEDEIAYLYQSKIFARGDIAIETPTPRLAYWQPFVIDYEGNRFSKYPPAWSLFLAFGVLVNQTWVVNGFFAMLAVAVTFRLGKDIYNVDVGLIAALLVAFSPMALLLNASLMGHTATLFWGTFFLWTIWRMKQPHYQWRWTVLAGVSLGIVILLRPVTGIAFAFPFLSWAISKILTHQSHRKNFITQIIVLLFIAGLFALVIPLYQFIATGSPTTNLYTLVWEYDQLGFGDCCGRNGHTLQQGIAHARWDLSLANADFFGWVLGSVTPQIQDHLRSNSDYFPLLGLSLVLFPIGGFMGLLANETQKTRTIQFFSVWLVIALFGIAVALMQSDWSQNPQFSWVWVGGALVWLVVPYLTSLIFPYEASAFYINKSSFKKVDHPNPSPTLPDFGEGRILESFVDQNERPPPKIGLGRGFKGDEKMVWILLMIPLIMIVLQLTYWIGSQRYSTRYYFEALSCIAILSALPIAWSMQYIPKKLIYAGLLLLIGYSFFNYSVPRIRALRGYNLIHQNDIDAIFQQQVNNQPLLVIVTGERDEVSWRAMGSLMAVTSPYLDSEIVVAWDYGEEGVRDKILARFPNRQIIEMIGAGNETWFKNQ